MSNLTQDVNQAGKESNQLLNDGRPNQTLDAKRKVISNKNIGKYLKIVGNKLTLDINELKADLPVDVHLNDVELDRINKKFIFTFNGKDTPVEVPVEDLFGTDTKVVGGETHQDPDGNWFISLRNSNYEVVDIDLSPFHTEIKEMMNLELTTLKNEIYQEIKDNLEQIVDLDGEVLGYTFKPTGMFKR